MFGTVFNKSLLFMAKRTGIGKRILKGVEEAKVEMQFEFRGLQSGTSRTLDQYLGCFSEKAPSALQSVLKDGEFKAVLSRYSKKNHLTESLPENLSMEELTEFMLKRCGVGPSKFAQIISSDTEIMGRFSPEVQAMIRRTQSDNPFSRTLIEAQDVVNRAFPSSRSSITLAQSGALVKPEIEIIHPLSAGTVGEAYLARTSDGREVIVKMIKKNVDAEQLELEEQIYTRLLYEFAPNETAAESQIKMLKNLYKDWRQELNFTQEFRYNKLLQDGAKRYGVADITRISEDGACILMDKADGVQMNRLMKMLQDYKSDPNRYFSIYEREISENEWLRDPEKIINELPTAITKAFDEQFMFMKKDGTSIMHGDPHMGNYFITSENGVLRPIFIDTGNCVVRNKEQICDDISFLANYFVGNSKGLAKYFVKRCKTTEGIASESSRLITAGEREDALVESISEDIRRLVFEQKANLTDVDKITKTMQTIMENHGLSIDPASATALKAQMQFYTGINETASLSGKTIDVATIVKDMPHALYCLLRGSCNPIKPIKGALSYGYNNQTNASRCVYQFLAPKCDIKMTMSPAVPTIDEVPIALTETTEKHLATV